MTLILQKINVPNVVAYLLTGFTIRNVFVPHLFDNTEMTHWFEISELLALGMIGFMIGTELKKKQFLKKPKIISTLLIAEVSAAFITVYLLTFLIFRDSLLSVILAGVATATDPAATIEVIKKNRAKGPVSSLLVWLLAFDDVFAILILEGVLSYLVIVVHGTISISAYVIAVGHEIGVAILIGLAAGVVLDFLVEDIIKSKLRMMEMTLAVILLVIGLAHSLETSVVVSTMVLGALVTNKKGDNYEKAKDLLEVIMSPIIAVFFIFIGAKVSITHFGSNILLIGIYVLGRSLGKILGPSLAAKKLEVEPTVKKYIGSGLLAQGGVALGLIIEANDILSASGDVKYIALGELIFSVIIITSLFSEIVGSISTYIGLSKAKELNKQKVIDRTH